MDKLSKLQALTGDPKVVTNTTISEAESVWQPKARHVYEGTDSESDEAITSRTVVRKTIANREPLRQNVSHGDANQATTETDSMGANASAEHDEFDFEIGQLAPEGEAFCLFQAMKKYPYTYIGEANRKRVDENYFAYGKLYEHPWDLFYIYREAGLASESAILLVPTRQFEAFLTDINRALHIKLTASGLKSFQVKFRNDGTPRPRYLGRAFTKEMVDELKQNVPPSCFKLASEPDDVGTISAKSIADFQEKMALLHRAQKGKAAKQEKKKRERVEKQKKWGDSIKRVQCYLGLRTIIQDGPAPSTSRSKHNFGDTDSGVSSTVWFDPDKPAVYDHDSSVIFISVDVEAYERNLKQITEIGISTLDTKDIAAKPPGAGGANWMTAIRARHFRVEEHKHLNNTEFVSGCADRFEFGESEFIKLADAPRVISTCFKHPFSKPGIEPVEEDPKRNIILVGHDIDSDISFLRTIGYNVHNLSNLLEVVDTASMWRYHTRELNLRKLGSVLADLGITAWNLHNAGNDATYTLQAMVGITIKHLVDREKSKELQDQRENQRENQTETQGVESATALMSNVTLDKEDNWSSAGDNSDGGAPTLDGMSPNAVRRVQTPAIGLPLGSYSNTHPQTLDPNAQPWTSDLLTVDDVLNSSW